VLVPDQRPDFKMFSVCISLPYIMAARTAGIDRNKEIVTVTVYMFYFYFYLYLLVMEVSLSGCMLFCTDSLESS